MALLAVLAAALPADAGARELSGSYPYIFVGPARAVAPGTLSIHGQRIRLQDIAVPARDTRCLDIHGDSWSCGREALQRLATLVGGGKVACYGRETEPDGTILAVCFSYSHSKDGESLNARLVAEGWAKPAGAYGDLARDPRRARDGIWSGRQLRQGEPAPTPPNQGLGLNRRFLVPGGAAL